MIFDDNYCEGRGDCLSLKQVGPLESVKKYFEFPPIFKAEKNRWGCTWDSAPPILEKKSEPWHDLLHSEATAYTWICYAYLRAA